MLGARAAADTSQIAFAAAEFHRQHGRWPALAEVLAAGSLPGTDPWRRAFRLAIEDGRCRVRSAGVDGTWNTCDDIAAESLPQWRP